MLHTAKQASGHTIQAKHIEQPSKEFIVEFHSPAYVNVLYFEAGTRQAETSDGAIQIARYHYHRGSNFHLVNKPN